MGELISLDDVLQAQQKEDQARMVEGLQELLKRAQDGELLAVAFIAVPKERQNLSIGLLKTETVGLHELVGSSVILSDYLRGRMQEPEEEG